MPTTNQQVTDWRLGVMPPVVQQSWMRGDVVWQYYLDLSGALQLHPVAVTEGYCRHFDFWLQIVQDFSTVMATG